MSKKGLALFISLAFLNFSLSPVYAEEAIVLSDNELDEIHAGGLNFNFDGFLGNANSTISNATKGSSSSNPASTANRNAFVINPNNSNVKILLYQRTPRAPTAPTLPKTASANIGPLMTTIQKPPVDSTIARSSTGSEPPMGQSSISSNSPVISDASVDSIATNATNGVNFFPGIDVSSAPLSSGSTNVPPTSDVSAAPAASASLPATPASVSEPALPAQAASPASTESTTRTSSSGMVVDVLAFSDNGKLTVAVGSDSDVQPTPTVFSANNMANVFNSVNVSDTAQQNLSAFVNVNAAGSVVPVQINLTVLMNSGSGDINVGNISNLNDLNVGQYTTSQ